MIRKADPKDFPRLMEIYAIARAYMKANGNPNQWGEDRPARSVLEGDIVRGQLFVVEDRAGIHGAFALISGADPTYAVIDGAWLDDAPYVTIHRLAGDGTGGIFAAAVDFAREKSDSVRIDTHADNAAMHHLLNKHGFVRCGTIWLENGDPRIAYQTTRP